MKEMDSAAIVLDRNQLFFRERKYSEFIMTSVKYSHTIHKLKCK